MPKKVELTELERHHDPVNYPQHYTFGSIQPVDAIATWRLNFNRGNVVKYVVRAGKKKDAGSEVASRGRELEDLRKARFYLSHEIAELEKELGLDPEFAEITIGTCKCCDGGEFVIGAAKQLGEVVAVDCPRCRETIKGVRFKIDKWRR